MVHQQRHNAAEKDHSPAAMRSLRCEPAASDPSPRATTTTKAKAKQARQVGNHRTTSARPPSASTTALPLAYLTSEGTLIGEELFVAEAYLSRTAPPQARLLTQDALRTVIIVAIAILLVLSAFGIQFAL